MDGVRRNTNTRNARSNGPDIVCGIFTRYHRQASFKQNRKTHQLHALFAMVLKLLLCHRLVQRQTLEIELMSNFFLRHLVGQCLNLQGEFKIVCLKVFNASSQRLEMHFALMQLMAVLVQPFCVSVALFKANCLDVGTVHLHNCFCCFQRPVECGIV